MSAPPPSSPYSADYIAPLVDQREMRKIAARNFVQFPQYPAEGSRLKSARNE